MTNVFDWIGFVRINNMLHNSMKKYISKKNLEESLLETESSIIENDIRTLNGKISALMDEKLKVRAKFDNDTASTVVLRVVERKDVDNRNFFGRIWSWIIGSSVKPSGHIMYFNKNMDMTLYDVMPEHVDNLFKIKQKEGGEAYMLDEYFGSWKGKKLFLTKFPWAISLRLLQEKYDMESDGTDNSEKEPALAYDAKAYYNLLEHTIKRNITKGESGGFDLIKTLQDYWIYIIIVGLGCFLFLTPQGKTMVQQIVASVNIK